MSEEQYYKDRYYLLLWALRDQPEVPSPLVLSVLGGIAEFKEDWDEGKRIQRERGLHVVPPKTECEMGAGWWHRVMRPVLTPASIEAAPLAAHGTEPEQA